MTAGKDIKCAINLFCKYYAHHSVCEGHFGDGEPIIGGFFYTFVHAECASDDECDFRISGNGNSFDLFCQFFGRDLVAFYAKRDFESFFGEIFQQAVAFFANDQGNLRFGRIVRRFFFL